MKKFKSRLNKDFLYNEYIMNKKSTIQIAKEIGCSDETVRCYLIKYKIKIRTFLKILTKKFLHQEYAINKKSYPQIANEIGCSIATVPYNLKKYRIEIRNFGEAHKGKNNGNYKHGETLKKHYCIDCLKKGIKTEICLSSGVYGQGRCNDCNGKFNVGKNHPNYIEDLDREYPIEFNCFLKEQIRKRDNYICQLCDTKQEDYYRKLDIHHIDYNKENLNPDNLISLCNKCNIIVNYNRSYWKEYFKNKTKVLYGSF